MKKLVIVLLFVAGLFCLSSSAFALPYSDVSSFGPQLMSIGMSKTYSFNLNTDTLAGGVDINAEDIINSANLGIDFRDDERTTWRPATWELAMVTADQSLYFWDSGSFQANVLNRVVNDHQLEVTVTSLWGDFYLGNATLSGDYTDRPATSASPVPEPGTMAMLGMGILGLFGLKKKS